MARNHVWRYTLRLFHTFAIFEKSEKINAKRYAKKHVFALKSILGRLWVDLFSIFNVFEPP